MIDLITGHQGVAHISAEQIANINNALMDDYGVDKVVRLDDGTLTQDGLTINVGTGFWRVNGFDMEIQEAETVYIDPTATGLSRIDNIYVEILQDIPTGSQRSEIVTVQGEAAASPVAPDAPTAPVLNTDILLQVTPLATVTVTEGAMVMTDLSVAYEMITPQELAAVQTIAENAQTTADNANTKATNALNMIRSTSSDAYSSSKAYAVGEHCIYNNVLYKCVTACSAAAWSVNQNCFEKTTLTSAVTDLNSSFNAQHRRKRGTFTPSGLRQCITSDGVDLSIMKYSIGDEYQINNNYKAVIADIDTFYGGYDYYASVLSHHVGLLIVGKARTITCKWNNSDSTASGYNGSVLHTTLEGLISTIESALGTLLSHQKLLTTATSSWEWQAGQKISALSESQIYGAPIWSIDGYQQGEAYRQLEVFRKFSFNEIFGNQSVWLRSAQSASRACDANPGGGAYYTAASAAFGVVGLVLFH